MQASKINEQATLNVHTRTRRHAKRNGAVIVLVAIIMMVLAGFLAFAVDYSFLLKTRTDMQRAADAGALAAVQTLVPSQEGVQDLDGTRATVTEYVRANLTDDFNVSDEDIEIGRYNPDSIYTSVDLINSGTFDAVRVTLRRDGTVNDRVPLFFARVFGMNGTSITVTATAALPKPSLLPPGSDVLPFGVPIELWEDSDAGDEFVGYGDGKVQDDYGNEVPGNWGTLDIGPENNSTSDLREQILNGLSQSDLDALYADGRISQDTHIDAGEQVWLQADPGLSSGMKSAVQAIHGQQRIVPIYESLGGSNGNGNANGNGKGNGKKSTGGGSSTGNGNNLEYNVTSWGVVTVVDSNWGGAKNTWVKLQKSFLYDGDLSPKPNSLDAPAAIEGAFGGPILIE